MSEALLVDVSTFPIWHFICLAVFFIFSLQIHHLHPHRILTLFDLPALL